MRKKTKIPRCCLTCEHCSKEPVQPAPALISYPVYYPQPYYHHYPIYQPTYQQPTYESSAMQGINPLAAALERGY